MDGEIQEEQEQPSKERFWLPWVLVNVVGWTVGTLVFPAVASFLSPLFSLPAGWLLDLRVPEDARPAVGLVVGTLQSLAMLAVVGAVLGIILGLAQWLVLRVRIPRCGSWMPATAIGSAIGWSIGLMANLIIIGEGPDGLEMVLWGLVLGSAIGAALGLAQWVVLKRFTASANAWLLASLLGWAVGLAAGWGLAGILRPVLSPHPDVSDMAIRLTLLWSLTGLAPGIIGGAITGIALTRVLQGPSDSV